MSDRVLLNVDLSQAELRCMALFSGDEWMIGALQEGQGDFFSNHMMPVCYPNVLDHYAGETWEEYEGKYPTAFKELRTKVKGVQYGLAFGRSAPAIARALEMPRAEAQQIITNYFKTAPKFAEWRKQVTDAAIDLSKRDLLVSPTGRRFQSEMITTRNMAAIQREALSFLPQSTSSDICIMSAMRLHSLIQENNIPFRIMNVVHDAVMLEGDEDYADLVGELTGQIMRETGEMVMGDAVPFLSDYSFGRSWADLS